MRGIKAIKYFGGDFGVLITNQILKELKSYNSIESFIYDESKNKFSNQKVEVRLVDFERVNKDFFEIEKNTNFNILLGNKGLDFLRSKDQKGILQGFDFRIYSENYQNFNTLYDYYSQ